MGLAICSVAIYSSASSLVVPRAFLENYFCAPSFQPVYIQSDTKVTALAF